MNKVTIFVEGISDDSFLRQLIRKIYGIELGKLGEIGGIIHFKGHNMQYTKKPIFEQSSDLRYKNLVFEDADLIKNRRGLTKVKALLDAQKQDHSLNFEYFIFPDNQKEEGTLEDLLMNLLKEPKNEWINCAKKYFECLEKNAYEIPDKHGRWKYMSNYLLDSKKLDFSDEQTWFIKENPYLVPLINFLDKHFEKTNVV